MLRPIRTLAAAAAALALVSACNSASTNGSSPGKGGDAPGNSRGVTADSVKVGGIVSMTSASGYSKKDTDLGAKARYLRANAEGGINGRKIDYLGAEDDGQDPAKNLAAARKLVQQDKVFAVAPMSSVTFSGADFLEQEKVPTFGWGTLPSFCGPRHIYGFNGCLVPTPAAPSTRPGPRASARSSAGRRADRSRSSPTTATPASSASGPSSRASPAPGSRSPTPRPPCPPPPCRATGPRT